MGDDDKEREKAAKEDKEKTPKDDIKEKPGEKDDKTADDKTKKEPEPSFEMLANPARVMRQQLKVLSLPTGLRYTPLKDVSIGGIIMLKNTKPGEKEDIIEPVAAGGPKVEEEEEEPEPPEPFEYTED